VNSQPLTETVNCHERGEMLVIRLRRAGSKKRPFFRVVVTDSRAARDSSFVEVLGHYNPRTNPAGLQVNAEQARAWLAKGALPTDTVRSLLKRAGVFGTRPPAA